MARQAPGTYTTTTTTAPGGTPAPATGTAFIVGYAPKGSVTRAVPVRSLAEFESEFGGRVSVSPLYDSVDAFFRLGGGVAYVSRDCPSTAVAATADLPGGSGTSLVATATNPGTWGNNLDVTVAASGGSFTVTVLDGADVVEVSPTLADPAAAVAWSAGSRYVRLTAGGDTTDPTAGTVSLAGGTDVTATTDVSLTAALGRFTRLLGPGTVLSPGATTEALHKALLAHVAGQDRVAALDLADGDASAAVTRATALYAEAGADKAALLASILTLPGGVLGASREIPWSVVLAAQAAQADRLSAPGQALAGHRFGAVLVPGAGLKRVYSDADRATLSDAGVTVATLDTIGGVPDTPQTFDDRTIQPYTSQRVTEFSDARIGMAVAARLRAALAPFAFSSLGGQGAAVAQAYGACKPLAADMWEADHLDGADYDDAYQLDVQADKPGRRLVASAAVKSAVSARVIQIHITQQIGA